jgi:hypothetical protein
MNKSDSISGEIKKTENIINASKYKTALDKVSFINEIRNGLGDEIKKNPSGVTIIKKPWYTKFGLFLKKIFTKF